MEPGGSEPRHVGHIQTSQVKNKITYSFIVITVSINTHSIQYIGSIKALNQIKKVSGTSVTSESYTIHVFFMQCSPNTKKSDSDIIA